jgi:hypothetical protein
LTLPDRITDFAIGTDKIGRCQTERWIKQKRRE